MSRMPAFQFYPADWVGNTNLRRCTLAARGAWMEVICVLHDSDEYGLVRWPLKELSQAAGVPIKLLNELILKNVLKGSDEGIQPYIYIPRSGRKDGEPVELISKTDKPLWYSSRLVRDSYIRKVRGEGSKFATFSEPPKPTPKPTFSDGKSDGPSSSSSSSSSSSIKDICISARKLTFDFFNISEIKNQRTYMDASGAIELIEQKGKLDYYVSQLENYKKFKNSSGQETCSVFTWIWGEKKDSRDIESGHWCREDYSQKFNDYELRKNRANQSKGATTAIRSGQIKDFGKIEL